MAKFGDAVWKDTGLEVLVRNAGVLERTSVKVGFVGPAAAELEPSGRVTVAEAGLINEFGSRDMHVPARRPLSSSITHQEVSQQMEKVIETILSASTKSGGSASEDIPEFGAIFNQGSIDAGVDQALDAVGQFFAEKIRGRIFEGDFEPNAPATIKEKGFDHPLMDSAGLAGAVGHELHRSNGDVVEGGAAVGDYQAFEVGG